MATINNQSPDEDRRREIALELMEAYVSLTCCCIFFHLVYISQFITFILVVLFTGFRILTIFLGTTPKKELIVPLLNFVIVGIRYIPSQLQSQNCPLLITVIRQEKKRCCSGSVHLGFEIQCSRFQAWTSFS